MANLKLEIIDLPLKNTWSISRGSDNHKRNFIVTIKDESFVGRGEAAFLTGSKHSEKEIRELFENFQSQLPKHLSSSEEMQKHLRNSGLPNPLKFGIESAFIHYLAELMGREPQQILAVNKISKVRTSISLPIMEIGKIGEYIKKNNFERFHALKVKVNAENAIETCLEASKHFEGYLRIDANEAYADVDKAMHFMEELEGKALVEFVEQPLPAAHIEDQLQLKKDSPFLLMADESLQDGDVTEYLVDRFHGVNVKTMKAGGYFKAIKQLREAKQLGLKTMIGCMVETSLGISSSLNIAFGADYVDLDGFLLLEKDPYGLVMEEKGQLFYSHFH